MNRSGKSAELIDEIKAIRRLLFYLLLFASGVVFYFGKDVFLPIVLGLLITLTLTPVVRFLRKMYVPAPIGAALTIATIGLLLSTAVSTVRAPMTELFEDIPRIGSRLESHFAPLQETVEQIAKAGDEFGKVASGGSEKVSEVTLEGPGVITSAATSFATGLTSVLIALILALFMLGSGTLFYEKLVSVLPDLNDKKRALRVVHEVEASVSRYLFTITLINVLLGLAIWAALAFYGAPNPALWGTVAAVLNFLPFLGALIGTTLLAVVSFGHFDNFTAALIPPLIYYGLSAIEGNLMTPYVVGRRMKLNIVAVFITVVFWGWLWGLMGALMAVPILLVLSVLSENIDRWHMFKVFLSGREIAEH